MREALTANLGSFRDPANKIFEIASEGHPTRILRALRADAHITLTALLDTPFFQQLITQGDVIPTRRLDPASELGQTIAQAGWAGALEHDRIPIVTYPYEWPFSMLKDAALLQLRILETALKNGWILKDATPFNIQWNGTRPVFIDVASFEPWIKGQPWVAYRQFCMLFLTPLLLRAHLDIDPLPLLRSWLDGIPPTEAVKYFHGRQKLKRGVLPHIVFPARVEKFMAARTRDNTPINPSSPRRQTEAMVIGLVQSLTRLIRKLNYTPTHTAWSHYQRTHSYSDSEHAEKRDFVLRHTSLRQHREIWDVGCNTGQFARDVSPYAAHILALDADHDSIELLYRAVPPNNILPLVLNLANPSPAQGWAGAERSRLESRSQPDLVLCLALIHHLRLSANIPTALFLQWLRGLNADVILEFVNRDDDMAQKLLATKTEQYPDYSLAQFEREISRIFRMRDRQLLKGGKREIFYLSPA